ncbi:MAG: PD-(D/E)XK nuclease family protein, partial [Phycisphaerae bacterium]
QGQSLGQLDERGLMDRLEKSTERIGLRPALAQSRTVARQAYQLRRSREELARVLRAQRQVAALGRFRSQGTEVPFGFDDRSDSLPALRIDTPAGRSVLLRGFIDRVDLAELADELLGVVIDYKRTTGKRLEWARVYHGLSLQLIGYLLALAEQGRTLAGRPIRPIGAFYVSLISDYEKLNHPDEYDEVKHSDAKQLRPRGLLDVGRIDALERDYAGGQASAYNVQTKDGVIQYSNRSDAVTPEQFSTLLEHTRYKLGELADGILDGVIQVAPYRLNNFSPCHWCSYRSVCRFEFGQGGLRVLPRQSQPQVLDAVTQEA